MSSRKITLSESEMPKAWYNIAADFARPMPPPVGKDGKPIGPDALARVFPMNLIEQEMSSERWIEIPEPVRAALYQWRPTPLHRAAGLERALGTPAKIFFKNESLSPSGSHKNNSAIPQAYYNKQFGITRLTTETGAGQWGTALSHAARLFGLECRVYMVRVSYRQKPMRQSLMRLWGARCIPSPSTETQAGRDVLAATPDTPGSLGIAISEAIEDAVTHDNTRYALGSVLNHVCLHQTIIGLEAREQFKKINLRPDVVVACAGGGSNFAGLAFPFLADKIAGRDMRVVAVESASCPKMTRGVYAYDSGDVAMMTPLLPMFTLGHGFIPPGIHAGGLRFHGMAPTVSHALREGLIEASAIPQLECFRAAALFAGSEGIVPAPESSHAIAQTIREALRAKEEGRERVIVFNLSGHGLLDLSGYQDFLDGKLEDFEQTEATLRPGIESIANLPKIG
ncbi:MAG: TrpB-like pyridoxal phosphate-dependent enzyme [Opitutaceae bacterium]|jgi:tryptophan synthase beta chain|nr:TrpB-like pyridoxal phosphate-dependent enzyme [Opitutaceae bacterium]